MLRHGTYWREAGLEYSGLAVFIVSWCHSCSGCQPEIRVKLSSPDSNFNPTTPGQQLSHMTFGATAVCQIKQKPPDGSVELYFTY